MQLFQNRCKLTELDLSSSQSKPIRVYVVALTACIHLRLSPSEQGRLGVDEECGIGTQHRHGRQGLIL